jgi:hypothetical protein
MIISAREEKDFTCKLYISFHKSDGSWTNPKSLGPLINEGEAHRFGQYVTPDNRYLFYTHGTSPKDCTIYWVRFDNLLNALRNTNFEPYVKKAMADKRITTLTFSIQIPEDTFMDDDGNHTLTYAAGFAGENGLPAWAQFDPVKRIISGKAPAPGVYEVVLTATDPSHASATTHFSLILGNPKN